jgi:hypothetical protein
LIHRALARHNRLYAPTCIALHEVGVEQRMKRERLPGPVNLNSPAGAELLAEITFVDEYFEKANYEKERKRREEQEKADEETARLLNFEEHKGQGGLLEWYFV